MQFAQESTTPPSVHYARIFIGFDDITPLLEQTLTLTRPSAMHPSAAGTSATLEQTVYLTHPSATLEQTLTLTLLRHARQRRITPRLPILLRSA